MRSDDDDHHGYLRGEVEEKQVLERVSEETTDLADAHFNVIFGSRIAF